MSQRRVPIGVLLALVVGLGLALAMALRMRRTGASGVGPAGGPLAREEWPPVPPLVVSDTAWVEPEGRTCPATYPIKAKLSSGLFHLPGMAVYDRTIPDRCYATAEGAELDGLQRAKH